MACITKMWNLHMSFNKYVCYICPLHTCMPVFAASIPIPKQKEFQHHRHSPRIPTVEEQQFQPVWQERPDEWQWEVCKRCVFFLPVSSSEEVLVTDKHQDHDVIVVKNRSLLHPFYCPLVALGIRLTLEPGTSKIRPRCRQWYIINDFKLYTISELDPLDHQQ